MDDHHEDADEHHEDAAVVNVCFSAGVLHAYRLKVLGVLPHSIHILLEKGSTVDALKAVCRDQLVAAGRSNGWQVCVVQLEDLCMEREGKPGEWKRVYKDDKIPDSACSRFRLCMSTLCGTSADMCRRTIDDKVAHAIKEKKAASAAEKVTQAKAHRRVVRDGLGTNHDEAHAEAMEEELKELSSFIAKNDAKINDAKNEAHATLLQNEARITHAMENDGCCTAAIIRRLMGLGPA